MIVFHAGIQFFSFSLSLLKIHFNFPVPQSIVLLSIAAAYVCWRRDKSTEEQYKDKPKSCPSSSDIAILSAGFFYVLLFVVGYIAEEVSWDGNSYHLPTIYFWNRLLT
jgi:hypothetical protein